MHKGDTKQKINKEFQINFIKDFYKNTNKK